MTTAIEAVSAAEGKLRSLIGEAASTGDYALVRRLSTAAERLATVREELEAGPAIGQKRPGLGSRPRRTKEGGRRSASSPSGYPRLVRRGDVLCRIGWSKKSRREYEHKVPKAVYDQSLEALSAVADKSSRPFAAQDVSEQGRQMGLELPSYQVYVVLALLCDAGVVERHGREGYTVTASNLRGAGEIAWAQVEEG